MMSNREIENRLRELAEEEKALKEILASRPKFWRPSKGEEFFFVTGTGSVCIGGSSERDESYIKFYNAYQTKEDATRAAFKQSLRRRLDEYAANNGSIDWDDHDSSKYYITYNYKQEVLSVGCDFSCIRMDTTYFESGDLARAAIKEFKLELVRYFAMNS